MLVCTACAASHTRDDTAAARRDAGSTMSTDGAVVAVVDSGGAPTGDDAGGSGAVDGGDARGDAAVPEEPCVDDPPDVPFDPAVSVAASYHTCVVTRSGDVSCWGQNHVSQLGDGTVSASGGAGRVEGLPPMDEIWSGRWHSCARSRSGELYCWGSNQDGQVGGTEGLGAVTGAGRVPTAVGLPAPVVDACAGLRHTCALVEGGSVFCWGRNDIGQLGLGRIGPPEPTPTLVMEDVDGLSCGGETTCATRGHELRCWGGRAWWALLDRIHITFDAEPTLQPWTVGAGDLVAPSWTRCVLEGGSGAVHCWGYDRGPLGRAWPGESADHWIAEPHAVDALPRVVDLSVVNHACAALADGTVRCWTGWPEGNNQWGQIGNGSSRRLPIPRARAYRVCRAHRVRVGPIHSCSWTPDGVVTCWGHNANGEIAAGLPDRVAYPVRVWPPPEVAPGG